MTTTLTRHAPAGTAAGRFDSDERRIDGDEKVSGQAKYSADFALPGMLWAAFLPTSFAHAKIVSIDTSKARELPGVHTVLTGRDIGEHFFGRRLCDWPVLAIDRVRFVGEFVAAVAAETPEIAEAAVELIEVEYEELPTLFDTEEALQPDALVLHEHPEKYPFMFPKRPQLAHKNMQGYGVLTKGDVAAAFAQADRTYEHTFHVPRYHGGYIEPRATMVWIDADDIVHVISTNKSPFSLRDMLAVTTGLPKEKFVIEPAYIGGEFGAKGLSVEEFPCYYLAAATGRPVKYVRSYLDDIRSTNVRHAAKITVKSAVMNDGRVIAQDVRALFDGGAYGAGKVIPTMLPGPDTRQPYAMPNYRCERICVYTNTVPGGFVRAPGDVQIVFGTESAMDLIAADLGIDPLELRRINAAREGDIDVEGHPILAPNALGVLDILERESRYHEPRPPGRAVGISLGMRHIGGAKTSVRLVLTADDAVEVQTGATEQGMGLLTMLQRVVAAELGLPLDRVRATRGATDAVPFDPGVGGSRTTHIAGGAALDAARQLRAALDEVSGAKGLHWAEACAALRAARGGEGVHVTGAYDGDHAPGHAEYNNFVGFAFDVTVDRETGQFTIHDVVFAADTGTIINPIAHQGQIDGGFMMGLGHAATEELVLEEGRIVNLSFADYKLPTQRDMPPMRTFLIRTSEGPGPFGARASGEINTAAVGPALANAVAAACGVRITQLPVTAERIYDALHRETVTA